MDHISSNGPSTTPYYYVTITGVYNRAVLLGLINLYIQI